MRRFREAFIQYFISKEEWVFFGLILCFSLARVSSNRWPEYLWLVVQFSLALAPVLFFKSLQPWLRKSLSRPLYALAWLLVFAAYLPLALWQQWLPEPEGSIQGSEDFLLILLIVELLLVAQHSSSTFRPLKKGIGSFGFDRSILLLIFGWAMYMGILIISNLELWHESNAVTLAIRPDRILANMPLTLWLGLQIFILYLCGFVLYYLNRHFLVKHILTRAGALMYVFALASTIVLLYPLLAEFFLIFPINRMGEAVIPAETPNAFDWNNGMASTAIMLVSLPIILALQWNEKNNAYNELEKEKAHTELNLLKQQINPHFLFNTLNNLYALCLKKSDQAPEVVLQLSDLMRYVVYEGRKELVAVTDEARYIKDYIGLHQIRLHRQFDLDLEVQLQEANGKIAPLLLIILVENAFKHGIEPASGPSWLKVHLRLAAGVLTFLCENSLETEESPSAAQAPEPGIGLANLGRRLELIYPNRHRLTTRAHGDHFTAELEIRLQLEANA